MNPILQQILGGVQIGAGLMGNKPNAVAGGINNFRHGGLMRQVNSSMPGTLPQSTNPPNFDGATLGFTMPSATRSQYNQDMVTE